MAQILLINFDQSSIDFLKKYGFEDIELKNTIWDLGGENIKPADDTKIVFYQCSLSDPSTSLHMGDSKFFEDLVKNGAVIVVFSGGCRTFHIQNLIGGFPNLAILGIGGEHRDITVVKNSPYTEIFSKYGGAINFTNSLFSSAFEKPEDFVGDEQIQLLAVSNSNHFPISMKQKFGEGFYLYLPYFDGKNTDVALELLQNVLQKDYPELFSVKGEDWIRQDSSYFFPKALGLHESINRTQESYERNLQNLKEKFSLNWEKEQTPFNKLLTSTGEELVEAVSSVFKFLKWSPINVDKFWETNDPSRQKEEDLWILDKSLRKIESIKAEKNILLAEVKGIKNTPTEKETTSITKYVNRRMKEFRNNDIKGIFIVNHLMGTPASKRKKPFTDRQIEDAKRNGELLLTTYELYLIVKSIKENKLSILDARKLITETAGELDYKTP